MSPPPSRVLVVHGPNLNLLGIREPERYGTTSLADIDRALQDLGKELGLEVECVQSNHEGDLVEAIQKARGRCGVVILNAAAYTHTSVALRDAILAVRAEVQTIEVHLTLPAAREAFRRQNLIEGAVTGRVEGFGARSYLLALRAASELLRAGGGSGDQ